MAAFRGFVEKGTGKIIELPNPSAPWGDAIHRQYYDFIVKQGLPAPNKPGRPWYEWRSDWNDNDKAKYFSSKSEAEKYAEGIAQKQVQNEVNSFGNKIDKNADTPQERLDNYRTVLNAYSSKLGSLNAAQQKVLSQYKSAAVVSNPKNIVDAINNYSIAFAEAKITGVSNLSAAQKNELQKYASQVRGFDSSKLGENAKNVIKSVTDVQDAINAVDNQREIVAAQKKRVDTTSGKIQEDARNRLFVEEDALNRLIRTANQTAPLIQESFSKVGLTDAVSIATAPDQRVSQIDQGLAAFTSGRVFQTGDLASKLNMQVTDQQILDDINTARKNEYKRLSDIGTATITDLESQITQAKSVLPSLPASQKSAAQSTITNLEKQLADVKADTLQAQNLYTRYTPISGADATTAISKFRESLRLPEERTLDQIKQIDPKLFETITTLGEQYRTMATSPLGPTTSESTEALRRQTEESIAAQLRLGSQLGAEEQRQYQQAARAAQTARGNIFGVAPAVEEAVTTGLAGEQRLATRLGAAQGFLASGQSVGDAMARDVSLRNALQQSRLGAASAFAASGPSAYNLASQRAAQQQALLQQYTGAATQQAAGSAGQFQAARTQMTPYAYVDPNAIVQLSGQAGGIYNTMQNAQASMYGDYARAQASQPTFAQQFGSILSGVSGFIPSFSFSR
jgi:uncharacterized protein YdbL (DUF1318 family)